MDSSPSIPSPSASRATRSPPSPAVALPAAAPAQPAHPERLAAVDRPYLVPWGRLERRRLLWRCLLAGAVVAAVAIGAGLPGLLALEAPLAAVLGIGILFFRNPRRRVPQEPGILVSPADGRVTDIERVVESEYIGGPAIRIGIFLSIFSVHVNRAPGAGRVEHWRYRPGRFRDARDPLCARDNESQTLGLALLEAAGGGDTAGGAAAADAADGGVRRILVRQVSGAIARRIVCEARLGETLARGGLYGMIKFGSRTELYVPVADGAASWEPAVAVGDRVRGGRTVVCRRRAAGGAG